jgi:hypothetical protein
VIRAVGVIVPAHSEQELLRVRLADIGRGLSRVTDDGEGPAWQ